MTIPKEVQNDYKRWYHFLEQEVQFSLSDSEKHTKEHCARVLLFALLIADKMDLSQKEREALCAAAALGIAVPGAFACIRYLFRSLPIGIISYAVFICNMLNIFFHIPKTVLRNCSGVCDNALSIATRSLGFLYNRKKQTIR